MPVFDFNDTSEVNAPSECTYTTYQSSHATASPDQPILVLDNRKRAWKHHSCGLFTNPIKRTAFEFKDEYACPARTVKTVMRSTGSGKSPSGAGPSSRLRTVFFSL